MRNEFIIYGSGISAKITASLLARNGFNVCLISDKDNNKKISNTNLVTFLSLGSLNYLLSIWANSQLFSENPEIHNIDCQLNSLSKENSQHIRFHDDDKKYLGKIIKNSSFEKFLDEEINQLSNISIINSNQVSIIENISDKIKLKLDNDKELEADLLILSSTKNNIAEQIGINFTKKDLKQIALSISIKGNIKNANCAFQSFTSNGPLALLPYSKNEASVVWSLKNKSSILLKNREELNQIINKHLDKYVSSVEIISIEEHELQFSYAKNLYYKNTILLGNVAHNIHPIAGQGLNLSIKDIALFVNQIIKNRSLGYKVNNRIALEDFEMKRKLDNTAYSFGTFALNDILSSNNKFINYATRQGLGLVEKSNFLKQIFVKSATGKGFFKSL